MTTQGSDRDAGVPGLELVGVSKLYGDVAAVKEVDLVVRQGEFMTLLGPSGSGKTTSLRLVAGFATPTSGSVRIAGKDMTHTPPHRRDVGMVFQNYALFPHMSIRENIAYPLRMRNVPKDEQKRRVDEALALVRMDSLGDRKPRQLSGGQQQRVALARAMVYRPSILLMDEPLGALDKKLREALQLEIRQLHQTLKMTVLYVTHDQEEALVLSDRIALFEGGRIAQLGGPTDLYDRPESVFVADFIGDSNVFRGELRADGDGWLIETGGVSFPARRREGLEFSAGMSVALVVRLEDIRLGAPGSGRIDGRIDEVIYLGPYVKYRIAVGGREIFARSELSKGEAIRQAGDAVGVGWSDDAGLIVRH